MKKIILSRTDNLGDVILTLPMAGVLKKQFPGIEIVFLGKSYTRPIISLCENIDHFIDWDELRMEPSKAIRIFKELQADAIIHVFPSKEICYIARKAGIPLRIATTGRIYHWFCCNRLVKMSRLRSDLHEAQLNLKMLEPLGVKQSFDLKEIVKFYGLNGSDLPSPSGIEPPLSGKKFNLILHPKSKGSAREWGLDNYSRLISLLPETQFRIFITGTRQEGDRMLDFLETWKDRLTDLTGKMTLAELIAFINACDGLVAASTGPLHIAAALGKRVIGLYAPMRPIFPARWAPLGDKASFLVLDKKCNDCRKSGDCKCIRDINAEQVAEMLKK